jgi:hypothetical protein
MNYWSRIFLKTYKNLVFSAIILILIFIIFQIIKIYLPTFEEKFIFKLFDLGQETNIPTYFSVLLFIILAFISWFIWQEQKKSSRKYGPWLITTFLFLFLGLDELAQIHENLAQTFQALLKTKGFLFFAWTIPYGIVIFFLSIYYLPFIYKLKQRKFIILGAIIFLTGAIIFEMIGSQYYYFGQNNSLNYLLISSIEEILEIAGLLIVLYGLKEEALNLIIKNRAV